MGELFDFSEVTKLAADLGDVADTTGPFIRKAVEVTARNVKDTARKTAGGARALGGVPASVDYDVKGEATSEGSSVTAEIGYNLGKGQGPLGFILEFGRPGVAPRMPLGSALKANQLDFGRGIDRAVEDGLKRKGFS